jgi:glucose-1-phosphate thymidylyltransferase
MTDRAVVLARGLGTRMQRAQSGVKLDPQKARLARRGLKMLMPVAGRPFLDYVADSLLRAGLRRICFVIAPEAEALRQHLRRIADASGAAVDWAVQPEPLGTGDAVLAAERAVWNEPFVLANADNLYPVESLRELAGVAGPECCVMAFERDALTRQGNIAPERARDFAVVTATADGRLKTIVEKPPDPEQYARDGRLWVNMNLYRFTPAIFEACRHLEPDPERGELELTAAVADLAASGEVTFRVLNGEGAVLDLTSRSDVPAAERVLAGRTLSF